MYFVMSSTTYELPLFFPSSSVSEEMSAREGSPDLYTVMRVAEEELSDDPSTWDEHVSWGGASGYNASEQQFDSFDFIEREKYLDRSAADPDSLSVDNDAYAPVHSFRRIVVPRTPVKIRPQWVRAGMAFRTLAPSVDQFERSSSVFSDPWKGDDGYNAPIGEPSPPISPPLSPIQEEDEYKPRAQSLDYMSDDELRRVAVGNPRPIREALVLPESSPPPQVEEATRLTDGVFQKRARVEEVIDGLLDEEEVRTPSPEFDLEKELPFPEWEASPQNDAIRDRVRTMRAPGACDMSLDDEQELADAEGPIAGLRCVSANVHNGGDNQRLLLEKYRDYDIVCVQEPFWGIIKRTASSTNKDGDEYRQTNINRSFICIGAHEDARVITYVNRRWRSGMPRNRTDIVKHNDVNLIAIDVGDRTMHFLNVYNHPGDPNNPLRKDAACVKLY